MNKLLFMLIFCTGCATKSNENALAKYVAADGNGLTRRIASEHTEIVTQLIPDEQKSVYKFLVYVNTRPEQMTDSILYHFNYRSAAYFRLVSGQDTIAPVLSERVANGRRELNQFTVLFDLNGNKQLQDSFSLAFYGNQLFKDSISFQYALSDLKKASKSLYGYE